MSVHEDKFVRFIDKEFYFDSGLAGRALLSRITKKMELYVFGM